MLAVLLVLSATHVSAQYNRDLVVSVMRDSYTLIGEINSAAAAEDFYSAGVKLMQLAEAFKSLEQTPPPRGSRAEWDRIHNELIDAAFRAIGACGKRDGGAVQTEMSKIMALNGEGHGKFK